MKILAALVFMILLSVIAQAQTISGTVTLTANATDVTPTVGDTECGVAFVQFFNGSAPLGPQISAPVAGTNNYVFSWDTKTVNNGAYQITAKATDKAGLNGLCDSTKVNVGTSNTIAVTVNNIPPDVATPTISISISVP